MNDQDDPNRAKKGTGLMGSGGKIMRDEGKSSEYGGGRED